MATPKLSNEEQMDYTELLRLVTSWEKLGRKTYPSGGRSIGHIPHVASEAYLHYLFQPLPSEELENIESQINAELPPSVKRFFLLHNGISLFNSLINIYGLRSSWRRSNVAEATQQPFSILEPNIQMRPAKAPDNLLFVGSLGDERGLIAALPDGQIIDWDRSTKSFGKLIFRDVFSFLVIEFRRTAKLFNEQGRRTG